MISGKLDCHSGIAWMRLQAASPSALVAAVKRTVTLSSPSSVTWMLRMRGPQAFSTAVFNIEAGGRALVGNAGAGGTALASTTLGEAALTVAELCTIPLGAAGAGGAGGAGGGASAASGIRTTPVLM